MEEFLANTDPTDATSKFAQPRGSLTAGGTQVQFTSTQPANRSALYAPIVKRAFIHPSTMVNAPALACPRVSDNAGTSRRMFVRVVQADFED